MKTRASFRRFDWTTSDATSSRRNPSFTRARPGRTGSGPRSRRPRGARRGKKRSRATPRWRSPAAAGGSRRLSRRAACGSSWARRGRASGSRWTSGRPVCGTGWRGPARGARTARGGKPRRATTLGTRYQTSPSRTMRTKKRKRRRQRRRRWPPSPNRRSRMWHSRSSRPRSSRRRSWPTPRPPPPQPPPPPKGAEARTFTSRHPTTMNCKHGPRRTHQRRARVAMTTT